MKKIKWVENILSVLFMILVGLIALHFDQRVSLCQGLVILGFAGVAILVYSVMIDLNAEKQKDDYRKVFGEV